MKRKIVGYVEMTKRRGKVVFVVVEGVSDKINGVSTDKLFLYDSISDKVTPDSIGKMIDVFYDRGYNGNAYVSDVIIK